MNQFRISRRKKIENFPLAVVPGMQISSFHFLYTKLSPHSIKSHERVKYTLTKQKISSSKHPSGLPIESIAVMAKFAIFSREPHEKQIIHFSRPKTTKLASSTKLPDPVQGFGSIFPRLLFREFTHSLTTSSISHMLSLPHPIAHKAHNALHTSLCCTLLASHVAENEMKSRGAQQWTSNQLTMGDRVVKN